jgi:hypothetical protein
MQDKKSQTSCPNRTVTHKVGCLSLPTNSVSSTNEEEENAEETSHIFDPSGGWDNPNPPEDADVSLLERATRVQRQVSNWSKGGDERQAVVKLQKFGLFVRDLRKEQGLTREALSTVTNVEAEVLFMLEKGLLTDQEIKAVLAQIAGPLHTDLEALSKQLTEITGSTE